MAGHSRESRIMRGIQETAISLTVALLVLPAVGAFEFDMGPPEIIQATEQTFPDPYMGDWLGTLTRADGTAAPLVAQIIALGKGNYRINLLNRFHSNEVPWAVIDAFERDGQLVQSQSERGKSEWHFTFHDNSFDGNSAGFSFAADRVMRKSKTLNAAPPDRAVMIFEGSSLDNFQPLRDFNGHLHLPGMHTGNCCGYLRTRIWSEVDQPVLLQTAQNAMMKFILNGQLVYSTDTYQAPTRNNNKQFTMIQLNRGWNDVFVKLVGYNATSTAIRITAPDGSFLQTIAEQNRLAKKETTTREFLRQSDQHLTVFEHSGPYFLEGKSMQDAFDHCFAPEENPESAIWKPLDITLKESDEWPLVHRLVEGTMEIFQGGDIMTRQAFSDYILHIEFRIPFEPEKAGQYRGNSGVYLHCQYEIQVLDSYGLAPTYQDCGAAYYLKPPDVNMSLPPMQWQTYDIEFHAPRFDEDGNKLENARTTVYHNGVRIHNNIEFPQPTGGGMSLELPRPESIHLQNHGSPVRYRNIWVFELSR